MKTRHFHQLITNGNYLSYCRFHCSETRVILINGYVEGTPLNPYPSYKCPRIGRWERILEGQRLIFQLPFKWNTRRFHQWIFCSRPNYFSSSSFDFNETRIFLINWYVAIIIKFVTTYTILAFLPLYNNTMTAPKRPVWYENLSGLVNCP